MPAHKKSATPAASYRARVHSVSTSLLAAGCARAGSAAHGVATQRRVAHGMARQVHAPLLAAIGVPRDGVHDDRLASLESLAAALRRGGLRPLVGHRARSLACLPAHAFVCESSKAQRGQAGLGPRKKGVPASWAHAREHVGRFGVGCQEGRMAGEVQRARACLVSAADQTSRARCASPPPSGRHRYAQRCNVIGTRPSEPRVHVAQWHADRRGAPSQGIRSLPPSSPTPSLSAHATWASALSAGRVMQRALGLALTSALTYRRTPSCCASCGRARQHR